MKEGRKGSVHRSSRILFCCYLFKRGLGRETELFPGDLGCSSVIVVTIVLHVVPFSLGSVGGRDKSWREQTWFHRTWSFRD